MQLILLTPDNKIENEIAHINQLFHQGLMRLHLRKYQLSEGETRDYIHQIDSAFHSRIVIHSHFHLFQELGLGGIHLNSYTRNDEKAMELIKDIQPRYISTSFHSWQEIEKNEVDYNYVFISPVFDSISKQGYKAAIDLEEMLRVKNNIASQNRRCSATIGLGGVSADNIKVLQEKGFDGGALLGAVWNTSDPVSAFLKVQSVLSH